MGEMTTETTVKEQLRYIHKLLKRERLDEALSRLQSAFALAIVSARNDTTTFLKSSTQDQVWTEALLANGAFRKRLAAIKDRPVELRKTRRTYLEFLIHTQNYFIDLVCILAASPLMAPETRRKIEQNPRLDGRVTAHEVEGEQLEPDASLTTAVYESIVRLGDLSRYREQIRGGHTRPKHALDWLTLAVEIQPAHGRAYYQRAMVFKDGETVEDQLCAIHDLYRAATSETQPFKEAINAMSALITKLGWQNAGNEQGMAIHPLLRTADSNWASTIADGCIFENPFVKDEFVLGKEGVVRTDNVH